MPRARHQCGNTNDGDAFLTLGYFTVAARFVETATNICWVRDASGRISTNLRTALHRHSTVAALSV